MVELLQVNKLKKMRIIYLMLLVLFFTDCNNKKVSSNLYTKQDYQVSIIDTVEAIHYDTLSDKSIVEFKPDIKINSLELANPESILKNIGDLKSLIIEDENLPHVSFTSQNKKEKLTLIIFPGSGYNDVYQFVIEENDKKETHKLNYINFITESGLKLGISKEEIIKLKGEQFNLKQSDNNTLISYTLDNYNNSKFLQQYNMPSYFMEFTLKEDKVIKIKFGFDYP